MTNNQAYLFLIFLINGIIIGLLFDFFRILRRSFKTKDFITYIEDILFWILTGLIVLYSIFTFNNGEIRLFIFLGIILGSLIYILTISKYIMKISVLIIETIKKIISYILKIFYTPINLIIKLFKKIFFKPITIFCINLKKINTKFKKMSNKFKNNVENLENEKNKIKN